MTFDEVTVRKVAKVFGPVVALRKVSLTLKPGVTFVVGKNGAGKSTLLSLLATLTRPTMGTILYGGKSAKELGGTLRREIGLAAEEPLGYGELTGFENVLLHAKLHRVKRAMEHTEQVIGHLELREVAARPMSGYSQGERRRLGLARALVHDPRLLLLDEPSSGLDGRGSELLVERIWDAKRAGALVVIGLFQVNW